MNEEPKEPQEQPIELEKPESDEPAKAEEPEEQPEPDEPSESEKQSGKEKKEKTGARPAARKPVDPALARAYRTRRPVEGKVEATIKGGFEIRIGRSRAFCPFSQIELHRSEDPEQYAGKTYLFKIIQFRRGGDDVVLSRRALLEEENLEEAKAVRATMIEGALMQGHVTGIADFGAFVDLGAGVQGLVHISELSHTRVTKVADAVKVGETVQVKIVKLHEGGGKISLSIRQAQNDPWQDADTRFQVGTRHRGVVKRLADFGAFVEIAPGLEALAPAREFPPVSEDWTEDMQPGTEREWIVLEVDRSRRRMSILPVVEGLPESTAAVEPGAELTGLVQKIERFGMFIWLGPGKVGLMPTVFTGIPQGSRMENHFRIGQEVAVEVLEVTEGGRRIRLAAQGEGVARARAEAAREESGDRKRPEAKAKRGSTPGEEPREPEGTFGTSMGDLLKAALEKKKP